MYTPHLYLLPFPFLDLSVRMIVFFQSEFQALLPKVLVAIKALLSQDEDQAAESMELFDVLAECEVRNGLSEFCESLQIK